MKNLEKLNLPAEVTALLESAKSLLDEAGAIDRALLENAEKLKAAENDLAEAEQQLCELDTRLALAVDIVAMAQLESETEAAKANADAKLNVVNRYRRAIDNLKAFGRAHDKKIEDLKSELRLELGTFTQQIIGEFEAALIVQLRPLVEVFAAGVAINTVLPNRNLLETVNATIERPSQAFLPLIRDGLSDLDGKLTPFLEIAKDSPAVTAVTALLKPVHEANIALGRYKAFEARHRELTPYVSRAISYRYGGEPKQAVKQAESTHSNPQPQEGNIAFTQTQEFFANADSHAPARVLKLGSDKPISEMPSVETASARTMKKRGAGVDVATSHLSQIGNSD